MPFLKHLSAVNRALIYEFEDIEEEEASKYLMNMGCPTPARVDEVVSCVGPRLVYLQSSLQIMTIYATAL